ncbi:MAG: CHAT domain-containing protein [Bacteroidota bacterium]
MSDRPAKALLEFFLTEDTLYTFVIRPDLPDKNIKDKGPIVVSSAVSEQEVQDVVKQIRTNYDQVKGKEHTQLDYDLSKFYELGTKIFSPDLLKYLEAFNALYLVPFGPLHYVPMHAFMIGGNRQGKDTGASVHLIDRFQVAYLPSASVLQYLKTRPPGRENIQSVFLGGVDYKEDKIHFIRETDQISDLSVWENTEKVYLNYEEFTKEAFFEHAPGKAIIHLSTHGFFNDKDPLLSGAYLAGEYSDSHQDADGRQESDYKNILTARDIFDHAELSAELFVLSGCFTGDSENKPGDELIGLTRALIYAGVRSMIVSLFPSFKHISAKIDDSSIRFARFYELWLGEGKSKGEALQQYLQSIKANPDFAHPYNWMQFILVGDMD